MTDLLKIVSLKIRGDKAWAFDWTDHAYEERVRYPHSSAPFNRPWYFLTKDCRHTPGQIRWVDQHGGLDIIEGRIRLTASFGPRGSNLLYAHLYIISNSKETHELSSMLENEAQKRLLILSEKSKRALQVLGQDLT